MQNDQRRLPTIRRWCGLAALAVLGGALLGAAEARAAVLLVPSGYPTIQEAIDAATGGDTVRVAEGTYFENIDFLGKAITVESADGPVFTTIDGGGLGSVVTFSSGGPDSVLTGFTIQNGVGVLCPGGTLPQCGGGIYIWGASPTITGNVFTFNDASWRGGAIFCFESEAVIDGNTFEANSAGEAGGAIYCRESSCVIEGNIFVDNEAWEAGGAIGVRNPSAPFAITDNVFTGNEAGFSPNGGAGAVGCWTWPLETSPGGVILRNDFIGNVSNRYAGALGVWRMQFVEVSDNLFQGNTAAVWAGAVDCYQSEDTTFTLNRFHQNTAMMNAGAIDVVECTETTMTSNTFWGNVASAGGAILVEASTDCVIANTILWANEAVAGSQILLSAGSPAIDVSYCCVEGGYAGVGNIDEDPRLADPDNGDFHLGSDSPCIDTGDDLAPGLPLTDFDGDPRIVCDHTDMGVDEYVPPGGTCVPPFRRGDVNQDGGFDIADAIFALSSLFVAGSPIPECLESADASDDGAFDIGDPITMLSALFVPGSPPIPAPHPDCGLDPTADCAVYVACP